MNKANIICIRYIVKVESETSVQNGNGPRNYNLEIR